MTHSTAEQPIKPAVHTALRIPVDDLAEIDKRAKERGISRTALLINAALDRLSDTSATTEAKLTAMDDRLRRLEAFAFGTD